MDALNFPLRILSLSPWNSTNALRPKVRVLSLNTTQATQVLVAISFPFSNEGGVGDSFFQAPFVEFTADGFA